VPGTCQAQALKLSEADPLRDVQAATRENCGMISLP